MELHWQVHPSQFTEKHLVTEQFVKTLDPREYAVCHYKPQSENLPFRLLIKYCLTQLIFTNSDIKQIVILEVFYTTSLHLRYRYDISYFKFFSTTAEQIISRGSDLTAKFASRPSTWRTAFCWDGLHWLKTWTACIPKWISSFLTGKYTVQSLHL